MVLLATELGLDANELLALLKEAGRDGSFLLDDLVAQASPITNPRVLELLREYDAFDAPFWPQLKTTASP